MSAVLKLDKVYKYYPSFTLNGVSFSVEAGHIMGFIGRNGAGKTTTLKCIMNLLHYQSGHIEAFGLDMNQYELENKQRIGFALSELNYHPNRKISALVNVTKRFYKDFDMNIFNKMCELFKLDQNKKLEELSSGMKVKYSVAIALSHHAELLILDEPTSGLDPVSRDEILDIFREIVKDGKHAILFSTHITSDLDKCASDITYITEGSIEYSGTKNGFISQYLFVKDKSKNHDLDKEYIASKELDDRIEGLIDVSKKEVFMKHKCEVSEPDLEQIMIYLERSKKDESFAL